MSLLPVVDVVKGSSTVAAACSGRRWVLRAAAGAISDATPRRCSEDFRRLRETALGSALAEAIQHISAVYESRTSPFPPHLAPRDGLQDDIGHFQACKSRASIDNSMLDIATCRGARASGTVHFDFATRSARSLVDADSVVSKTNPAQILERSCLLGAAGAPTRRIRALLDASDRRAKR